MRRRLVDRFKFSLEQMFIRGAHFRLLVIAATIGLISSVAGLVVLIGDSGFEGADEAIWWAFLRITDPGYLGDDEGVFRTSVSMILTVLGPVIFFGALVAIMTQWLTQTLSNFERGLTPIAQNDHVLVLGWTNRTASTVRELLLSEERVRHFLRYHGARNLHVVLLVEEVTPALVQELRAEIGSLWNPKQIILRSGSALHVDHLQRVDFANAAAILVPGADFVYGGAEDSDTRIIKTVLSVSHHGSSDRMDALPLLVTEMFDIRKLHLARQAYGGKIEILASNLFIGRLIAQAVRHPGISHVFSELLGHGRGNEIYTRPCREFEGMPLQDMVEAFPNAVLLGLVRPSGETYEPVLNPPADTILQKGERLVLLARSFADTAPQPD